MPPRARAARARKPARAPSASAASDAPTPAATTTTTTRDATPPGAEATTYTVLEGAIAGVFNQAQKTTAGHRKLVINLRGVFEQCLAGAGAVGGTIGADGRRGEKAFTNTLCRFLDRVLVVKKSEVVGDRCLRFADMFVRNLVEVPEGGKGDEGRGREKKKEEVGKGRGKEKGKGDVEVKEEPQEDGDVDMADLPASNGGTVEPFKETSATRAVLRLLNHLEALMASKEKVVRYRTTQFLALLLSNALPTFPFDYGNVSLSIFRRLCTGLTKRIQDKEAMVRVQAAVCLVKLLEMGVTAESDDDESDEEQAGIVATLIESMQNDPSADVRRTILYNVSPTPATLPYLLERVRDTDHATRRAVFTRLLPELGDFRHLSIGMREKLLRWGLNDRDESVRVAARKMFNYRWVEDAGGDLLEVLERLDVTNEGLEGGPKDLALANFWAERTDVVDEIAFDDEFWDSLTPESSFLVRSFNDFCRSGNAGRPDDVEEKMPEVTRLAFYLQRYLNKLVAALRSGGRGEAEAEADAGAEAAALEFVVQQLLLIAASMDYGDEIGRRKMFSLLRESLAIPELNDDITKLVVECLGKLSMGEGDFCMLILEVIAEVHDTIEEETEDAEKDTESDSDSFHSAASDVDASAATRKGRSSTGGEPEPKKRRTAKDTPARSSKSSKSSSKPSKTSKSKRKGKARPSDSESDVEMEDADAAEEDGAEDGEDGDTTTKPDDPAVAKALQELMVNLKCLHIAQCMLECVSGNLKANTHLVTMLNGLVVPAVRSHEAPVRERGLRCLGLSCLLDRTLAEENLTLFAHCFNRGHEGLQVEALHIISDILLVHGKGVFDGESCSVEQKSLFKMFAKALRAEDLDVVQATAAEVVCKLMLAQVVQDDELLKTLVTRYFDPSTLPNQSLRQTLSYFLPVYSHSSPQNQARMTHITLPLLHSLLALYTALDDAVEKSEMVAPATIAAHLADWTDPRKVYNPNPKPSSSSSFPPLSTLPSSTASAAGGADMSGHLLLAADALERLPAVPAKEKKLLLSLLPKLYLNVPAADASRHAVKRVYDAVSDALERKVAPDAAGRNTLNRIEVAVAKLVAEMEIEDTVVSRHPLGGESREEGGEGEKEDAGEEGEGEKEEGGEEGEGAEEGAEGAEKEDAAAESDRTPAVTDDESD